MPPGASGSRRSAGDEANQLPIISVAPAIASATTTTADVPLEKLIWPPGAFAAGGVPNDAASFALPACVDARTALPVVVAVDPLLLV